MKKIKFEVSQLIMIVYLIILVLSSLAIGINPFDIINDSIVKICMNAVLVLSLIPMINAGMGMNFGMPIGATCGTLGMLSAIQFKLTGFSGFFISLLVALILATIFGYVYGKVLNQLKAHEEVVGMFAGLCFIPLMNIFYIRAPFTNRQMLFPVGGSGLRPKINLEGYFADILDKNFIIKIGVIEIPIILIIFVSIIAYFLIILSKSLLGDSMQAAAENPMFAKTSGININKIRLIAVIFSSVIAAIGLIVYAQSYGFVEAYSGPVSLVFPAVSAILIGGAKRSRASVANAIAGVILYQCTYLLSVPVANKLLIPQMAEIIRMFITNGIILYAFLIDKRDKHAK